MVLADYIGVVKFSQWVKVEWFGDLMLIYKNDHPHASEGEYGGSIQILPYSTEKN